MELAAIVILSIVCVSLLWRFELLWRALFGSRCCPSQTPAAQFSRFVAFRRTLSLAAGRLAW